jgi:hypothetical protein
MSPDSQEFEQLRRLIALKRHEQPPPGYFHHFSREVILRIKAGELGESAQVRWWGLDGTWIQKLWTLVEAKPVLASSLGVAFCGFFVATTMLSEAGATADVGIKDVPQEYVSRANLSTLDSGATIDLVNLRGGSAAETPSGSLLAQPAGFEWQPKHPLVLPVNYYGH